MKIQLNIPEVRNFLVLDILSFSFSGAIEGYEYNDIKSFNYITIKTVKDIDTVISEIKAMYKYSEETFVERIFSTEQGALKLKIKSGDRGYRDGISFSITE